MPAIGSPFAPRYVVWELTLACDLTCQHCGSRAGRSRPDELSRAEAFDVISQLAALGTREITLIGGEAHLRPDWLEVVAAIASAGIRPTLVTGGRSFTHEKAREAAHAGLAGASVSIDGLSGSHDQLRQRKGSHEKALAAVEALRSAGIAPYVNTQLNRLNAHEIEPFTDLLLERRVEGWQVQFTVPMGRAADHPEILLQPHDLLDVFPRLAAAAERLQSGGCLVWPGNNVGYMGPYERVLRRGQWNGCTAGRYGLGIEANGDIKACPSLPSIPYVAGNVRNQSIADLWRTSSALSFARDSQRVEELWGFCGGCDYREICKGGCSWTAHALLGRRGNNPYCHHRARVFERRGLRERLVQVERAPGHPFDVGRFAIVVESAPSRTLNGSKKLPVLASGRDGHES